MKLSRGAGLIFGIIMGAMMAFLFAPWKGKDFVRRVKKDIRNGGIGWMAVKESFAGMGRNIVEVHPHEHLESGRKSLINKIKSIWQRKN